MDAGNHDAAALVQTFTCQPSEEQLSQGLKQFKPWSSSPTQSSASVIFTLVNITIPELWRSLASTTTSKKTVRLLTECLSSVSGVNALLLRLDSLHAQALKSSSRDEQNQLQDVLQVLSLILEGDKFCPAEVIGLCRADNSRGKLLFNEYVTLVGGSRILNVVSKVASSVDHGESYWIAEGKAYSRWLGKRIGEATYLSSDGPEVDVLLGKSLSLGYPYSVIEGLMPLFIQGVSTSKLQSLSRVLSHLPGTRLLLFIRQLLQYLAHTYFDYKISREGPRWWEADSPRVGAAIYLITAILSPSEDVDEKMLKSLGNILESGSSLGNLSIQRICIRVATNSKSNAKTLVENLVRKWGDKAYINHTPISAQEVCTQLLLLSLSCRDNKSLKEFSRSPKYNEGLSNRLSASIDRQRFLGMIVGEAVSRKVDLEQVQLKFKVPETEDPAAEALRSLIDVDDKPTAITELHSGIVEETEVIAPPEEAQPAPVEDFLVDDHMDWDVDNDLRRYPVPESDAEDSDDDPMLVNREKIPTPLYIRDLIEYLQADNYDKVHMGLKTAPNLIRQKANFGTELSDQAHDLARIILGMQDTYEMEQFQEMRQAALIALVGAAPENVVSYLINAFFTGDISIQQRCILLSAVGIGARELAGLEKTETIQPQLLPPALHRQYYSPMDRLSQQLEGMMIEPIREEAIMKVSGPQILQVRRFSSIPPEKRKPKGTVNALSKLAGRVFVFPLLGRWWMHQQDYGGRGVHSEPIILSAFVRTVGVILLASAPSALDLKQMTREYWDLLLALRSATIDPAVNDAILFGMLAILEITEPRVAAENYPKQVVETQAWAAGTVLLNCEMTLELFQGLDEGKAKMMAGGILLKAKEIVTKHERLLLGDIISVGSISSAPMGLRFR